MGGFGTARFAELKEVEFVAAQNAAPRSRKKEPKTKLHSHEADISLAARSLHSVVLTLDETGPLKAARAQGGKVVLLKNFDRSGMSLRKFVETELGDA